jgi:hypothetical protein
MGKRIVEYAAAILIANATSISSIAAEPQDIAAPDASKAAAATELGRNQLARELQIDASKIEALSAEARTWSDSSLGCGKPGALATQVITPGYEVTLKTAKGNYRVHATDKYAVVCGAATQWRNPRNAQVPLKGLNDKVDWARADLASKLSAQQDQIRTMTFVATVWPDTSMDCVVDSEQVVKKVTRGYRIVLSYAGRIYTYHTDMDRVRACPAIEVE